MLIAGWLSGLTIRGVLQLDTFTNYSIFSSNLVNIFISTKDYINLPLKLTKKWLILLNNLQLQFAKDDLLYMSSTFKLLLLRQ